MAVEASWSNDYVDIHGHPLNVLNDENGEIFIPLKEIRRTGYHIFPKNAFNQHFVRKQVIMNEFNLFMVGAAQEYLLENNIRAVNKQDILDTIEMCKKELNIQDIGNVSKPSGVLGRTLLTNPTQLTRDLKSTTSHVSIPDNGVLSKREDFSNDPEYGMIPKLTDCMLRPPHQQERNSSRQSNSSVENLHYQKPNNQNRYGNANGTSGFNSNGQPKHRADFIPNAKHIGRKDPKDVDINDAVGSIKLGDCTVRRIALEPTMQKVRIVHIDTFGDKQRHWVQLADNEDVVIDIVQKSIDAAEESEPVVPKLGGSYIGLSDKDGIWYRVVVLQAKPLIRVNFIDYGNNDIVSEVKQMPKNVASIPAQAVQITFCKDSEPSRLHLDQVLCVEKKKEYENGVILVKTSASALVNSHNSSTRSSEREDDALETVMMKEIKYVSTLTNGDKVKIVSQENGKFYLRDKTLHEHLRKNIMTHLMDLPREVVRNPKIGQLVSCKKNEEDGFCRAVVRDIDDGLVQVQYVDFHTKDMISLKGIYGVTKKTASLTAALVESPVIKGYDAHAGFGDVAESQIDNYIANNSKFDVVFDGKEFDLLHNGEPLSKTLCNKSETVCLTSTPSAKPPTAAPSSRSKTPTPAPLPSPKPTSAASPVKEDKKPYKKITFDEMPYFEAKLGTDDYMVVNYKSPSDFTVVPTSDLESELLSKCTSIDVTDEEEYEPGDTEMILGRYQGEWYRSVAVEKTDDGNFNIMFVDYGNLEILTKKDIRRFPEHLAKIPIMGLTFLIDVPDNEKVTKKLEDVIQGGSIYGMEVLSFNPETLAYTVKIPKIDLFLKKEGLI